MTSDLEKIKLKLSQEGFGEDPGAYLLVDGQFGSTGKGLAASVLAELFHDKFDWATTNAGPNSGHTSYFGDEKIVLRQLPTFAVVASKYGHNMPIQMNAGAIIDIDVLEQEERDYFPKGFYVWAHPLAAVADDRAKEQERELVGKIGSTGKGTGAALANKIMRDPSAVIGSKKGHDLLVGTVTPADSWKVFVEVSQGFSLGLNQKFYPQCTSRECTVGAAMADAGIHPSFLRQTMMVVRTFPIRVAGDSGPCYEDQKETSWEEIGQTPELTTVTKKVRRVFNWSDIQFRAAVRANRPDYIFLNFCNYLDPSIVDAFVYNRVIENYANVMGKKPRAILLGYGPRNEDVKLYEGE